MDTYVYELDDNLYINLTNRCSNNCSFCVRNGHEGYFGNKLWLQKEPSAEDVLSAIDYGKKYRQVVFCGFGEPTERADVLVEIAREVKRRGEKQDAEVFFAYGLDKWMPKVCIYLKQRYETLL